VYNSLTPGSIEKYSSAVTLSDMEVFIFPQLMYSLVLANIMSGRLWRWKRDPWFAKAHAQGEMKRVQRLKQYIMDHFSFNLDLDTWGLTTKEREIARFAEFINPGVLSKSNALFGYEGDKYYFDIDIRRHFGLDKYTSNIVPYWKTETLEAMEAFRFKEGYTEGAGECVSLAALYASAAFAVAGIPLDKIFMLATPLHSQNFLDIGEGVLTNNRRIVTKNMWYNGTELSAKARRALENETVTIVTHNTGYIHTLYPAATIDKNRYNAIKHKLTKFLSTGITYEILANFLRHKSGLQHHFQISHARHGKTLYIGAEKVYSYEHSSKLRVGDATQENLLREIEDDEFYTGPRPSRFDLGKLEAFFGGNRIDIDNANDMEMLKAKLSDGPVSASHIVNEMVKFCNTVPMMPSDDKDWAGSGDGAKTVAPPISLDGVKSAEDAIEALRGQRKGNETADLAFMAFRDLSSSPWKPFLKAAAERNPVCLKGAAKMTADEAYKHLTSPAFASESIYDEAYRVAQPDEVWNFGRGDGVEKAIALGSIYINKKSNDDDGGGVGGAGDVAIDISGKDVKLTCGKKEFLFETKKRIAPPISGDWEV
jgi:hypothetical protein